MLFIFVASILSVVLYLFGSAKNLKEYSDSIYLTITLLSGALGFAFVSLKMGKILQFIENLEDIVNASERPLPNDLFVSSHSRHFSIGLMSPILNTIYTQTDEKIKKLVEMLNFAMANMTPILVTLPTFIGSFVAYFTTDLGADALELPLPTMW